MTFFLFLLLLADGPEWQAVDTGVFQPLYADEVLLDQNGRVYVLNFDDAQVVIYNADGSKFKTFGRKGKGPGEVTYPVGMYLADNKLYLQDALTISLSSFTLDGEFIERVKMPHREVTMYPTAKGWAYIHLRGGDVTKMGVYTTDRNLENQKMIIDITDPGFGRGTMMSFNDGRGQAKFSALAARPVLQVSPDGKTAYLSDPEAFKIKVYDLASGKITSLQHDGKKIPFDSEWAGELLKKKKESVDKRGYGNVKCEAYDPDFFPAIREFRMLPDGTLVFDRWRGKPDEKNYPIALNTKGKEIPMPFSWKTIKRLVGVHDGYAYLTMYLEGDEEGWVTRVPVAEADQFVADNPRDPEAENSRNITISN